VRSYFCDSFSQPPPLLGPDCLLPNLDGATSRNAPAVQSKVSTPLPAVAEESASAFSCHFILHLRLSRNGGVEAGRERRRPSAAPFPSPIRIVRGHSLAVCCRSGGLADTEFLTCVDAHLDHAREHSPDSYLSGSNYLSRGTLITLQSSQSGSVCPHEPVRCRATFRRSTISRSTTTATDR
jgi:hypothetical protein